MGSSHEGHINPSVPEDRRPIDRVASGSGGPFARSGAFLAVSGSPPADRAARIFPAGSAWGRRGADGSARTSPRAGTMLTCPQLGHFAGFPAKVSAIESI